MRAHHTRSRTWRLGLWLQNCFPLCLLFPYNQVWRHAVAQLSKQAGVTLAGGRVWGTLSR